MNLRYSVSTKPPSLRIIHSLVIDDKKLVTTRSTEVLELGRVYILNKFDWKRFKQAVRLNETFEIIEKKETSSEKEEDVKEMFDGVGIS